MNYQTRREERKKEEVHDIREALRNLPQEVRFAPDGLKATTAEASLREALWQDYYTAATTETQEQGTPQRLEEVRKEVIKRILRSEGFEPGSKVALQLEEILEAPGTVFEEKLFNPDGTPTRSPQEYAAGMNVADLMTVLNYRRAQGEDIDAHPEFWQKVAVQALQNETSILESPDNRTKIEILQEQARGVENEKATLELLKAVENIDRLNGEIPLPTNNFDSRELLVKRQILLTNNRDGYDQKRIDRAIQILQLSRGQRQELGEADTSTKALERCAELIEEGRWSKTRGPLERAFEKEMAATAEYNARRGGNPEGPIQRTGYVTVSEREAAQLDIIEKFGTEILTSPTVQEFREKVLSTPYVELSFGPLQERKLIRIDKSNQPGSLMAIGQVEDHEQQRNIIHALRNDPMFDRLGLATEVIEIIENADAMTEHTDEDALQKVDQILEDLFNQRTFREYAPRDNESIRQAIALARLSAIPTSQLSPEGTAIPLPQRELMSVYLYNLARREEDVPKGFRNPDGSGIGLTEGLYEQITPEALSPNLNEYQGIALAAVRDTGIRGNALVPESMWPRLPDAVIRSNRWQEAVRRIQVAERILGSSPQSPEETIKRYIYEDTPPFPHSENLVLELLRNPNLLTQDNFPDSEAGIHLFINTYDVSSADIAGMIEARRLYANETLDPEAREHFAEDLPNLQLAGVLAANREMRNITEDEKSRIKQALRNRGPKIFTPGVQLETARRIYEENQPFLRNSSGSPIAHTKIIADRYGVLHAGELYSDEAKLMARLLSHGKGQQSLLAYLDEAPPDEIQGDYKIMLKLLGPSAKEQETVAYLSEPEVTEQIRILMEATKAKAEGRRFTTVLETAVPFAAGERTTDNRDPDEIALEVIAELRKQTEDPAIDAYLYGLRAEFMTESAVMDEFNQNISAATTLSDDAYIATINRTCDLLANRVIEGDPDNELLERAGDQIAGREDQLTDPQNVTLEDIRTDVYRTLSDGEEVTNDLVRGALVEAIRQTLEYSQQHSDREITDGGITSRHSSRLKRVQTLTKLLEQTTIEMEAPQRARDNPFTTPEQAAQALNNLIPRIERPGLRDRLNQIRSPRQAEEPLAQTIEKISQFYLPIPAKAERRAPFEAVAKKVSDHILSLDLASPLTLLDIANRDIPEILNNPDLRSYAILKAIERLRKRSDRSTSDSERRQLSREIGNLVNLFKSSNLSA